MLGNLASTSYKLAQHLLNFLDRDAVSEVPRKKKIKPAMGTQQLLRSDMANSPPAPPAPPDNEILNFGTAVSGFFLRQPNGRLIALTAFFLARDFSKVAPRMASADFTVLDPFIAGTKASQLVLVLHPADRAQSYFLLDATVAGSRRTMKIFQDTEEIIMNCLENDQLPVIELEELKRAILISRKNQSPVSLRIRHLELRDNLPKNWLGMIKEIFEVNLKAPNDKTERLENHLETLRREVRATMFKRFLSHCIWIDAASGELGSVTPSKINEFEFKFGFTPFVSGDAQMYDFIESLAKDEDGHYVAMGDQANVYPVPLAGKEWTSPTVHFYDEDFRKRMEFEEYYSLYRGMERLSELGAPVLVYERDSVEQAIPVRVLKPSAKGGALVSLSVASFASRNIVWSKGPD